MVKRAIMLMKVKQAETHLTRGVTMLFWLGFIVTQAVIATVAMALSDENTDPTYFVS